MAKLYFRYGTMGSAKTLNLLAVAHNYQEQGKTVSLMKPKIDVRFGELTIRSRAGLEKEVHYLLEDDTVLDFKEFSQHDCLLVDEAQFVSPLVIDQFRKLTIEMDVPVICYGLRTDFRSQLFPGAKRLMEIADSIEEVKTTCNFCGKKAIFNMKFIDGQASLGGPTIDLGAEEKYLATCTHCYFQKLGQ